MKAPLPSCGGCLCSQKRNSISLTLEFSPHWESRKVWCSQSHCFCNEPILCSPVLSSRTRGQSSLGDTERRFYLQFTLFTYICGLMQLYEGKTKEQERRKRNQLKRSVDYQKSIDNFDHLLIITYQAKNVKQLLVPASCIL